MTIQQLLREWPPGYGGVERVAHELGNCWGGVIFSLDVQGQASLGRDPLPVSYPRKRLRSVRVFGRLYLPLPTWTLIGLLTSSEPFMVIALPGGIDIVGHRTFLRRDALFLPTGIAFLKARLI